MKWFLDNVFSLTSPHNERKKTRRKLYLITQVRFLTCIKEIIKLSPISHCLYSISCVKKCLFFNRFLVIHTSPVPWEDRVVSQIEIDMQDELAIKLTEIRCVLKLCNWIIPGFITKSQNSRDLKKKKKDSIYTCSKKKKRN